MSSKTEVTFVVDGVYVVITYATQWLIFKYHMAYWSMGWCTYKMKKESMFLSAFRNNTVNIYNKTQQLI